MFYYSAWRRPGRWWTGGAEDIVNTEQVDVLKTVWVPSQFPALLHLNLFHLPPGAHNAIIPHPGGPIKLATETGICDAAQPQPAKPPLLIIDPVVLHAHIAPISVRARDIRA